MKMRLLPQLIEETVSVFDGVERLLDNFGWD